jgi:hypothetical protein
MKKDEITIGNTYSAKVSDKVVPIRIDRENSRGGWDATNLVTNKTIRIKSAQRLRGPVERGSKKAKPEKSAKAHRPLRPSGLSAAYQVLFDAGEPLQCKAMVEKMLAGGTWKTGGKTPEATIYAAIIREIWAKGADSRFRKTDRGLFEAVTK